MALESASYISQLVETYPSTGDQRAQGDDHLRMLKAVLKATFPGRSGPELRVIEKAAAFTPATNEIAVIYVATATLSVNLPALGGIGAGTTYFIYALTGTVTLTPNGTETLSADGVLTQGTWALISKRNNTSWAVLRTPKAMTAAEIVSTLGTTPVNEATHAASATTATSASTAAACTGNSATATSAAACTGNAATASNASALGGQAPSAYALASQAATDHNHNAVYAPMTAVVSCTRISAADSINHTLRFTRANGTTFDVIVSQF